MNFQIPGVNHFVWLTQFYYNGENAFPYLDDWIEKRSASYWEKCDPSSELGPKAVDLYKRFGVFPIGDTCTPGRGHLAVVVPHRLRERKSMEGEP